MDVAHLTINAVMAVSILVAALMVGRRIGSLEAIAQRIDEKLPLIEQIPVIATRVGTVEGVTSKLASDHNALARKVARLHGESTGRWHIPPDPNGDES